MSKRLDMLTLRRRGLELRSERLRRELATDAEIIGGTVAQADRVIEGTRRYGSPAMLVLGGVILVLLIANPGRSLGLLTRGLVMLSMAKRALGIYRNLKAELSQPRV